LKCRSRQACSRVKPSASREIMYGFTGGAMCGPNKLRGLEDL
jgi:hypothetical protein